MFIQPIDATAVIEVAGFATIKGHLVANGTILLSSPNGIYVGPQGLIKSRGFIARIAPGAEVLQGNRYRETRSSGSGIGIENLGRIEARGGEVRLFAERVVHAGTIDVSDSAMGSLGGTVLVLGQDISLIGGSLVDATGEAGGGTILIGGDCRGEDPAPRNARSTEISRAAVVKADGGTHGDGGTIIVWADTLTSFAGTLSARGGALTGDGGLAEISGKERLRFDGQVDLSAPHGRQGTLLLDPASITVVENQADADLNGDATTGDDLSSATQLDQRSDFGAADSVISDNAVESLLALANLTLAAQSKITVNAAIDTSSGYTFTLDAPEVELNAPIHSTGPLLGGADTLTVNVGTGGRIQNAMHFLAANGVVNVAAGTYSEAVTATQAATIRVPTGTAFADSWTSGAGITLGLKGNLGASGNFNFQGPVTLEADTTLTGASVVFASTLDADSAANNRALAVNASGTSTFGDIVGGLQALGTFTTGGPGTTVLNGGTVTTSGTQTFNNAVQLGATTTLTAGDGVTFNSSVDTDGMARDLTIDPGTGTVWFNNNVGIGNGGPLGTINLTGSAGGDGVLVAGTLTLSGSGPVALSTGVDTLVLGKGWGDCSIWNQSMLSLRGTTMGGLSVTVSGYGITQTASLTVGGPATFDTGWGSDLTLGNGANDFTTVAIASGRNITLADANGIDLGSSTVGGNLDVTANGPITDSGQLSVSGTATFSAGGVNDITLNNNHYFATVAIGSGHNVILTDANMISLGSSVVSGCLEVTAGGAITQNGALSVGGASTFNLSAASADVLLGTQPNYLSGSVTFAAWGAGSVRDVSLRNIWSGATYPTLPTGLRHLTLCHDTAPITVPTLTVSGNLTLNSGGITTLSAPVNAFSLSTDSAGTTLLNGGTVTTSGEQTYGDPVTLGTSTTLTADGSVTFNGTVDGGGNSLSIAAAGTTTFGGSVNGVDALTTDAPGATVVNGPVSAGFVGLNDPTTLNSDVDTYSAQDYSGAVTLGGAGATRTLSGLYVFFRSTLTGGSKNLTVSSLEEIHFGSAVSGVNALTTQGPARTTVNGPINAGAVTISGALQLNNDVTTSGGQTYYKRVTPAGARTLSSPNVNFYGDLSLEIRGPVPGTQYDQLNMTGTANLSGAMDVRLSPAYEPVAGTSFAVLNYGARSGMFSRINGLEFGGGRYLNPILSPNSLTLVSTNGLAGTPRMSVALEEPCQVKVRLTGIPGRPYVIQATTNLTAWTDLFTDLALTGGLMEFIDSSPSEFPRRFYRAREVP